MSQMGQLRIGISGWTYEPWRSVFYPSKLPQHSELPYAASKLTSIEINGTFYSLQKPDSFAKWADAVPGDFVFSVKAPRFITHILRLANAATPVANFFASGLLRLGPKLGPILWQLPPSFRFDPATLEAFLKLLPHDTEAAVACAHNHDKKVAHRSWLQTDAPRPVRHAIEIRHKSFAVPEFIALLRQYNVALVCADTVEWPRLMDVTADFIYCRLHGNEALYASGYDDPALDVWAARVRAWAQGGEPAHADRLLPATSPILDDGKNLAAADRVSAAQHAPALDQAPAPAAGKSKSRRRSAGSESASSKSESTASESETSASALTPRDIFVYFDNDTKVRAPFDAQSLMQRLGVTPSPSAASAVQVEETANSSATADPAKKKSKIPKTGTRKKTL